MSGDVQPRKRKDKKRKKEDLGIEEPRGTAAALGEGDVFMHSQHDHGTGGHWCAKIIFFSLLAVLITLIGLIILENRGLSELEANAVESRYSGVLDGWLEEVPDDGHHDEHTLELTHHALLKNEKYIENQDDTVNSVEAEDDYEKDEDSEHVSEEINYEADINNESENIDSNEEEQDDENTYESQEDIASNEGENDNNSHENIVSEEDLENENNNINYDEEGEDNLGEQYNVLGASEEDTVENNDDDNENSQETDDDFDNDEQIDHHIIEDDDELEEDEDHDEDDNEGNEVELEHLEKENTNEELDHEPISTELPALREEDDDDENDNVVQNNEDNDDASNENEQEEDEYLELDSDTEEPAIERITASLGEPLLEVEEEVSSERPPDTLEDEEEYEKRQEELRREEQQSSHMWLKLTVGGALLVATHAVMRRATHARDPSDEDEPASREETPLTERRMTLIPPEEPKTVPVKEIAEEPTTHKINSKMIESVAPIVKQSFLNIQNKEDEEEKISDEEDIQEIGDISDEEDVEIEEDIVEEKSVPKQTVIPPQNKSIQKSEPEEEAEEDPDDVEIIDEEQLEEELEEEEDISDVDDAELLTRLEAKYGRLPEPERPGQKYKDGGNSVDEWPDEPSDTFWRAELDAAERELRQGAWESAGKRAAGAGQGARARWVAARSLELAAEARRDNRILSQAIAAYLHLLKMHESLSDEKLLQVTERTLDRINFRGNYLNAEPVYRLLIRRFPNNTSYRNNLTISFLMANRADLAEESLKETLKLWPNDRVALAHHGFVLKTRHNRYEEAVVAFQKALEGDAGPAAEPRFYYHYGDSLLLLGRFAEAHEVHKRGAALGFFLSSAQRSLYNVVRLKSTPWWNIEATPYSKLAKALEKSWKEILKEGEAAKALYEKEKEGLKERGDWTQLDLFVQGREIPGRCKTAPVTCSIVKTEPAAAGCRRGQIKFSAMEAGTHVRPHVGPTNCRLRMHLGLSNTKDTYIRVDKEIRQWQEGKVFMFDDSFEHEVWHNGTGARLVLIVDVWHPQLSAAERRQLPAI